MDSEARAGILTPELRDNIIKEAMTWIGTPFHHRAHMKGVGTDCGGFVYEVYRPYFGLPAFPTRYAEDWALHAEDEKFLNFMKPYIVRVKVPDRAEMVVWKYGKNYSHASIYIGNKKYIHSWGRNGLGGVTISHENFFHARHVGKRPCLAFTANPATLVT